jgi:ethanolamine ammonia-lyase small subunit
MAGQEQDALAPSAWPEILQKVRARTPARLLVGRVGAAYPTQTQLELREAHATARDAAGAELDLRSIFSARFLDQWKLFAVSSLARSRREYLLRPDLGRRFNELSRGEIVARCTKGNDIQVAIGDGLSVPAIAAQIPTLLPFLLGSVAARGWSVGQTFVIRYCRVGILNEIGELLDPAVVVLLIGERPGLATAASLSAYMAYRPRPSHTDANRNLISNIHQRGLSAADAIDRILRVAETMIAERTSGCSLKVDDRAPGPRSLGGPTLSGQD